VRPQVAPNTARLQVLGELHDLGAEGIVQ
jgi:hypothetical protein